MDLNEEMGDSIGFLIVETNFRFVIVFHNAPMEFLKDLRIH
jgi:hypothetical protein